MYDLIGDIHGHADELVRLLEILGYRKQQGIFKHPERKVVFLGDFIDRGAQIRQVLEIVRPMVESEAALSVMGNHELNALAFHTEDPESPGEYLRCHTPKNVKQHRETIQQLNSGELQSHLNWFRTLPMWLDLDGLRVVHACWDEQSISQMTCALEERRGITNDFLQSACKSGNTVFDRVEVILKGKEASLPEGIVFHDKDGHARSRIRTRWYLSPEGQTYQTYALESAGIVCCEELEASVIAEAIPYSVTNKPVFIGHYWLSARRPEILADNVACLDFSVAKGGFLCAYRWYGEQTLSNANFVWVDAASK